MAKCEMCGKKGIFLKVNAWGRCEDCERKYRYQESVKFKVDYEKRLKEEEELRKAKEAEEKAELERKTYREPHFFVRYDEWYLMYSYRNVGITLYVPDQYYHGDVSFDANSENVAVILDGVSVGFVSDSAKSKMLSDFLLRGDMVKAEFDGQSSLYIAFYKKLLDYLDDCESAIFALVKTSKKDSIFGTPRYESIDSSKEYDLLKLNYDDESASYVVLDLADGEMGELKKTDSKKILEKENEGFDVYAFCVNIGYNDSGRAICDVKVYFK